MLRNQKNKVLINLLLEEIEEKEVIINEVITKKVHDMFQSKKEEEYFSILIEKHFFKDEKFYRLRMKI